MESAEQKPEGWSDIASSYERVIEPLTAKFAAEAFRLLGLKPGERVIDVAAGPGAFSLLAARAGREVLAVDFAPGMVARLRERIAAEGLRGIQAERMDGQSLEVPDASFDASVSVLGLIFFPDIPRGLSELRRVVRPGGRAAVVCWKDPATIGPMALLMQAIKKVVPDFTPPPAPPVWARLMGTAVLRARMEEAGFREVKIEESSGSAKVESPEEFLAGFMRTAPPVAHLFERLGPVPTEAVGRAYLELLSAGSADGSPVLSAEACIGIGRV